MSRRILYTSALDATRTVMHDVVRVEGHGPIKRVTTATGLEFLVEPKGDVKLLAGGGAQRHLHLPPKRCGVAAVMD